MKTYHMSWNVRPQFSVPPKIRFCFIQHRAEIFVNPGPIRREWIFGLLE